MFLWVYQRVNKEGNLALARQTILDVYLGEKSRNFLQGKTCEILIIRSLHKSVLVKGDRDELEGC